MAKINTTREYIDIHHPKFKELKVTCALLEPIEHMDLMSRFVKYQKHTAVVHPETGELVRDDDGDIVTRSSVSLPSSAIIEILQEIVTNIQGLEDENDRPIPFTPDTVKYLFKKGLNVKETSNGKEISMSFADYIQKKVNEEVEKELEEESQDSPKAKSSKKPS